MGNGNGGEAEEEERNEEARGSFTAGPTVKRRCTDIIWLALFLVYLCVFISVSWAIWGLSDTQRLLHGHDHTGALCGVGDRIHMPYTYYPDLQTDFEKDPTMRNRYGVCVASCPAMGTTIPDEEEKGRRKDVWYVPLPSYPVLKRCIPYENKNVTGMAMCAYPECEDIGDKMPEKPEQICGLKYDGTGHFWLLDAVDTGLRLGWDSELMKLVPQPDAAARKAIIDKREKLALAAASSEEAKKACKISIRVERRVILGADSLGLAVKLLTQYTGLVYYQGAAIYENKSIILGLGLGGAFVLSFILICLFSYAVRGMLIIMTIVSFIVLIVVDYILFVQAHVASGNTLRRITRAIEGSVNVEMQSAIKPMLQVQADENSQSIYLACAVALAIGIALLLCAVCAFQRNFALLVALLKEASRTVREMPSLLLLPVFSFATIFVASLALLRTVLGVLTLEPKNLKPWIELVGADPEDPTAYDNAQRGLMWLMVFSFLWIFFFHVAIFISTVAGAVAQWFFFRKDPDAGVGVGRHADGWFFGRPVLLSLGRVMRYHLGSLAFGSLVIAIATMPRLILEYIDQQTKGQTESNPALQGTIQAMRCCLCCLEKCLKFLTEYAYVNVAVSGRHFCKSAHDSVVLFAKYPVQVTMDKMASAALKVIACVTVPGISVVLAFFMCDEDAWVTCALVIAGLSFMVTRLAVGVYDICVTTLFVCVMRDVEYYDGKYMSEELSTACGLPKKTSAETVEIEMIY